jgi:hypothetical protein
VEIIGKEFSYVIIPAEAQCFPVSYQERKVKWKEKRKVTKHRNLNEMYVRR